MTTKTLILTMSGDISEEEAKTDLLGFNSSTHEIKSVKRLGPSQFAIEIAEPEVTVEWRQGDVLAESAILK